MSHTIRVSTRVYRRLQELAKPFEDTPDTVLVRVLGLGLGLDEQDKSRRESSAGELQPLIDSHQLSPGDELVWERPRRRERFTAVVTDNGCLRLGDGRIFPSPSGAAVALAGGSHNGWIIWVHTRTGKTIDGLR